MIRKLLYAHIFARTDNISKMAEKSIHIPYLEKCEDSIKDAYDSSFGENIGLEIRTHKQNIYYVFYDIDGNGFWLQNEFFTL